MRWSTTLTELHHQCCTVGMMTCISEELCYGYIQWIMTKFLNEEPS